MASAGKACKLSPLNIMTTHRRDFEKMESSPRSSEGQSLLTVHTAVFKRGSSGAWGSLKLKGHQTSLPLSPTVSIWQEWPKSNSPEPSSRRVLTLDPNSSLKNSTAWIISILQQRGSALKMRGHRGRARVTEFWILVENTNPQTSFPPIQEQKLTRY